MKKNINNILVLGEDLASLALWVIKKTLENNEQPMVFMHCIDVATEIIARYPQIPQLCEVTELAMRNYQAGPLLDQVSLVSFSMVLTGCMPDSVPKSYATIVNQCKQSGGIQNMIQRLRSSVDFDMATFEIDSSSYILCRNNGQPAMLWTCGNLTKCFVGNFIIMYNEGCFKMFWADMVGGKTLGNESQDRPIWAFLDKYHPLQLQQLMVSY